MNAHLRGGGLFGQTDNPGQFKQNPATINRRILVFHKPGLRNDKQQIKPACGYPQKERVKASKPFQSSVKMKCFAFFNPFSSKESIKQYL